MAIWGRMSYKHQKMNYKTKTKIQDLNTDS